jgi:hypothetical protein
MAIGGLLCALRQQSRLVGASGHGLNGPRFTGPSLAAAAVAALVPADHLMAGSMLGGIRRRAAAVL